MAVSDKGLSLIKKWEGSRLKAYLDPVGIPTIGYGTIAYPDGRAVQLGDTISQEQADGYLVNESTLIATRVEKLVTVPLNQNQFDALVSLTYNIGVGAFADSTLLRELNQSDFQGAAEQFLVWNKGTINGVKQPIAGLANRRNDEKALFESDKDAGNPIVLDTTPTPQQKVTWLEGYQDGDKTVVVGWSGSDVVEIVSIDSKAKQLLIKVLNQYPRAANFVIAPSGKSIPGGQRISILDKKVSAGGVPPATTPPFAGAILSRGSEGEQVKTLQLRLQELGIYNGPIDGEFGTKTDVAVRDFQSDEFGNAEADGRVGPKTWASLWSQSPVANQSAPVPGKAGKTYLRLTKTSKRDRHGLNVLVLEYIKNGAVVGSLNVNSGAPGRQSFRIGTASVSGSLEPLPEGQWKIHTIAWADGRDNYNGQVFSSGLGPVSTPLTYVGPGSTSRSAIEIHIDFNQNSGAPGTAGCVGIQSIGDYKILVGWLRDTDPENLYVDWGLGTTPKP